MTDVLAGATVLDTSVLSNFAHVDRVELLSTLPRVVTVPAVRDELRAGVDTHGYLERALTSLDDEIAVVGMDSTSEDLEATLLETLDPGEAQVLAVSEATDGTAVTDDGDARTVAKDRSIPITGSIGLLVRFLGDDELSIEEADRTLKRWIDEAGFRSPARDVEAFLSE